MTRQDYLDGKVSHEEYYRALAKALYVEIGTAVVPRYEKFIPKQWETLAKSYLDKGRAFRVFREFGDVWSTAGMVCVYLQAFEDAKKRLQEERHGKTT